MFADSIGGFNVVPELEDDTELGSAAREIAGAYLEAHVKAEFNIPGITFGYRYDGSPIIVSDVTELPPDVTNEYTPTASPGGRAPHAWLSDGVSIYDKFGFEFTLLRLVEGVDISAFEAAASARGIPLNILDLFNADIRALYESDIALIRPDQIVVWRGNVIDDAESVLAQVTGH